jgi:hypothetical protein
MQDMEIFEAKIRGDLPADDKVVMSIRCIEIAEEAHQLLKK